MDERMRAEMHERLVATRNEIARRGHNKGRYMEHDGSVCLYGGYYVGLLEARGEPVVDRKDLGDALLRTNVPYRDDRFARLLGFDGDNPRDAAITWNDDPATTKEMVLARLDEAIAKTAPEPAVPELTVCEAVT